MALYKDEMGQFLHEICTTPDMTAHTVSDKLDELTGKYNPVKCGVIIQMIDDFILENEPKVNNLIAELKKIYDYRGTDKYILENFIEAQDIKGDTLTLGINLSRFAAYVEQQIPINDVVYYALEYKAEAMSFGLLKFAKQHLEKRLKEKAQEGKDSTGEKGRPRYPFSHYIAKGYDEEKVCAYIRSECSSGSQKRVKVVLGVLEKLDILTTAPSYTSYNECFPNCIRVSKNFRSGNELTEEKEYDFYKRDIEEKKEALRK